MKNGFDPYYKWLGIPPKDQPPNHYRLLGIELFESDREVIDAAANRVMAYLKDLAVGDEAEYSQKLLNEVARARICLLSKEKKVAYDETLREELAAASPLAERPDAAGITSDLRPPPLREGIVSAARPGEVAPPALRPPSEPRTKVPPLPRAPAEPPPPPAVGKRRASNRRSPMAILIAGGVIVAIGGIAVLAFVMVNRAAPSVEPVEVAVAPPAPAEPPLKPAAPPKTKPVKPRVRPQPKRRSPVDGPDVPLPPMSQFLPKTAETGPTGLDAPQSGSGGASAKPPLDTSKDPSTGMSPVGPPVSPSSDGLPAMPTPATDTTSPPATTPQAVVTGAWRGLPAAVTLTVPASADASRQMTLGKVHLSPGQACTLKLLGGEEACRGAQAILLRAVPGETVERHWGIGVRGPTAGSETEIARLAVGDDGTLGLEWQPAAGTDPAASQLANCVLSLETAGESHRLLLREPVQVDELVVDLDRVERAA